MSSRPVCKFFQQGYCKFGDNCRNDHPRNDGPRQNNNRFAPLNEPRNHGNNNSRDAGNHPRGPGGHSRNPPRHGDNRERYIDQEQMRKELSNELPIWLLSCYSPRADLPRQLFGGADRELSSEEVRLRHYELAAQGQMDVAVREAETVYQAAKTQTDNVLRDVYGAIKYLQAGYDEHPNRFDVCNDSTRTGVYTANNDPSVQAATSAPGGFNQSSGSNTGQTFGQVTGNSAFGQPTGSSSFVQGSGTRQTTGFGQVPAPGNVNVFARPSDTGFGQSSIASTASAFGQPSALGQNPGFGQKSASANPFTTATNQPAFGQTTNLSNNQTVFARPSALTPSPFVQPAQQNNTGFGQPSNPFSHQQQSVPNSTAFNQASGTLMRSPTVDSNMQMSPTPGAFAAPSTAASTISSGFGQPTVGFAQPASNGAAFNRPAVSSGFGQSGTTNTGFNANAQQLSSGARTSMANGTKGKLQNWNGRPVRYVDDQPCFQENDGSWQRIWFPEGPPEWAKPEILPQDLPYDGEIEERYRMAKQDGVFKDGFIPLSPPKREWINWNF